MSYCDFSLNRASDDVHKVYHDFHYGFPITDDNELFGRLILEINQAGLSWETILKKQEDIRNAYDNFNIEKIANYDEQKIEKLLSNSGIIRNRLKINATIYNAKQLLIIKEEFGTFQNWLDAHHPQNKDAWVKTFKKKFKFVGGEIVNEFLMSIGYLKGAHDDSCPVYKEILNLKPKWYI